MSVIYPIGTTAAITLGVFVPLWAILNNFSKRRDLRPAAVPPGAERVLILGASSGIGRTLAHKYAERGAKICAVARRGAELEVVRSECEALAAPVSSSESASEPVITICADVTCAEDLITIREIINESESSSKSRYQCCILLRSLQGGTVSTR
jgi:NADPH:quinone reductase-like Zn-dependent oxidoreductase